MVDNLFRVYLVRKRPIEKHENISPINKSTGHIENTVLVNYQVTALGRGDLHVVRVQRFTPVFCRRNGKWLWELAGPWR